MTESTRECQKAEKIQNEISILGALVALSKLFFTILSCELSFLFYPENLYLFTDLPFDIQLSHFYSFNNEQSHTCVYQLIQHNYIQKNPQMLSNLHLIYISVISTLPALLAIVVSN